MRCATALRVACSPLALLLLPFRAARSAQTRVAQTIMEPRLLLLRSRTPTRTLPLAQRAAWASRAEKAPWCRSRMQRARVEALRRPLVLVPALRLA